MTEPVQKVTDPRKACQQCKGFGHILMVTKQIPWWQAARTDPDKEPEITQVPCQACHGTGKAYP